MDHWLEPYLDDRFAFPLINNVVLGLRAYLQEEDKDYLRQVRDKYGRLDVIVRHDLKTGHLLPYAHPLNEREGKFIRAEIHKLIYGFWNEDQLNNHWEHLTLCAIENDQSEETLE